MLGGLSLGRVSLGQSGPRYAVSHQPTGDVYLDADLAAATTLKQAANGGVSFTGELIGIAQRRKLPSAEISISMMPYGFPHAVRGVQASIPIAFGISGHIFSRHNATASIDTDVHLYGVPAGKLATAGITFSASVTGDATRKQPGFGTIPIGSGLQGSVYAKAQPTVDIGGPAIRLTGSSRTKPSGWTNWYVTVNASVSLSAGVVGVDDRIIRKALGGKLTNFQVSLTGSPFKKIHGDASTGLDVDFVSAPRRELRPIGEINAGISISPDATRKTYSTGSVSINHHLTGKMLQRYLATGSVLFSATVSSSDTWMKHAVTGGVTFKGGLSGYMRRIWYAAGDVSLETQNAGYAAIKKVASGSLGITVELTGEARQNIHKPAPPWRTMILPEESREMTLPEENRTMTLQ